MDCSPCAPELSDLTVGDIPRFLLIVVGHAEGQMVEAYALVLDCGY